MPQTWAQRRWAALSAAGFGWVFCLVVWQTTCASLLVAHGWRLTYLPEVFKAALVSGCCTFQLFQAVYLKLVDVNSTGVNVVRIVGEAECWRPTD
jgi:hypothetical protein